MQSYLWVLINSTPWGVNAFQRCSCVPQKQVSIHQSLKLPEVKPAVNHKAERAQLFKEQAMQQSHVTLQN